MSLYWGLQKNEQHAPNILGWGIQKWSWILNRTYVVMTTSQGRPNVQVKSNPVVRKFVLFLCSFQLSYKVVHNLSNRLFDHMYFSKWPYCDYVLCSHAVTCSFTVTIQLDWMSYADTHKINQGKNQEDYDWSETTDGNLSLRPFCWRGKHFDVFLELILEVREKKNTQTNITHRTKDAGPSEVCVFVTGLQRFGILSSLPT